MTMTPGSKPLYQGQVTPRFGVQYVTISQACASLGISRRTVYNWLSKGYLQWCRTASGHLRIVEASLWSRTSLEKDTVVGERGDARSADPSGGPA